MVWPDFAAIGCGVLPFLTAPFENAALTGSLLAKPQQLWPVSTHTDFFARKKMTRPIALLIAALTLLAGAGHAQAQGFFGPDTRELMNTGPSFFGGGASPIPRTTVRYAGGDAPGPHVLNTGEPRPFLRAGNGQPPR